MRICFIELQPFPTTIGGGTTHILELSKALIKQGNIVDVVSSKPAEGIKDKQKIKGINIIHVGIKHKKLNDFRGIKRLFYFVWRAFFEAAFIIGTAKVLRKNKYNIINSQSPITSSLPAILARKKFFITAHGVYNRGFMKLYGDKKERFVSKIASLPYRLIEKFNVRNAEKVICLGKDSYEYYSKLNDSVIIPNGVDLSIFKFGEKKDDKRIISVGRLSTEKGVGNLISSMDQLKDYNLDVIGLGPLEKEIKEMCAKRKNCNFLGYKKHDILPNYMKKPLFIVIPSIFEALPITMLEGMACGCIPVTTKVGDIPDVITEGKNGFFLKDNSPNSIAEKIIEISKKKVRDISKNARNLVEKEYSWQKIAKEYLKIYNGKQI